MGISAPRHIPNYSITYCLPASWYLLSFTVQKLKTTIMLHRKRLCVLQILQPKCKVCFLLWLKDVEIPGQMALPDKRCSEIVPLSKEDSFLEVHLHLLRETSIWTFSTNWTLQVEAGLSKKFSKHFIPAFEKLKWSKAASMYGPLLPALGKLQWFGCLGLSVLGNVSNGHCRPALSLTKWMALLTSTAYTVHHQ